MPKRLKVILIHKYTFQACGTRYAEYTEHFMRVECQYTQNTEYSITAKI